VPHDSLSEWFVTWLIPCATWLIKRMVRDISRVNAEKRWADGSVDMCHMTHSFCDIDSFPTWHNSFSVWHNSFHVWHDSWALGWQVCRYVSHVSFHVWHDSFSSLCDITHSLCNITNSLCGSCPKETPPPPQGGGSISVPWSRAVCKGFHDEMRLSHLVVKCLTHGSWSGDYSTKKPPKGGGGFLRSKGFWG